jgi:GNAT superfamily N-acetyltransferase
MRYVIREEPIRLAEELAFISIAFEVKSVLACSVQDRGLGGVLLSERRLDAPYWKDYDAFEDEGPGTWAGRFDLSRWAFFGAHAGSERIGGAVVAFDTEGIHMLEGRRDLAVLWDLRVAPQVRGRGVGAALFGAVADWAVGQGCRQLKVETQNTNVAACRFYARQGCVLGALNRFAYPDLPEEVQLLWYKVLDGKSGA